MPLYFDRVVELNVGTKGIRGLRVSFEVIMTPDKKADTAIVKVWGASAETRAQWQAPEGSAYVVLKAGYGKDIFQIFAGDSRTVRSTKQGVEWITEVTAGDGERTMQRQQVNETLRKGKSPKEILLHLLGKVEGIDVSEAKSAVNKQGFREGLSTLHSSKTLSGPLFQEIDTMMQGFGLDWSTQNGKLKTVPQGATIDLPTIPSISPGTGLIGTPEAGEKGVVEVTALLDARIKPLHKFELRSASFNGYYKAGRTTYTGDTHGRPFYVKTEATPV